MRSEIRMTRLTILAGILRHSVYISFTGHLQTNIFQYFRMYSDIFISNPLFSIFHRRMSGDMPAG